MTTHDLNEELDRCRSALTVMADELEKATARALMAERLESALECERVELTNRLNGSTHWDGCEQTYGHEKCAALKRIEAALTEFRKLPPLKV